jgi:glycosyltransferase involved in cell wall biosynthesis
MIGNIVVLTTTYNCENYIDLCINSIKKQTHKNFKCFITDDMSTDNTVNKIKTLIEGDNRFTLIENTVKMYQPGNYDQIINGLYDIDDEDICVEVDGDDWLYDENVFKRILNHYNTGDIWMANGKFMYHDGRIGFASPPKDFKNIRKSVFTLSHIRTWKAFLWRDIEPEDLKDDNGEYWKVAGDLSFMYPMIEMCGEDHYRFMNEVNYIYNESNPLNDHKVNMDIVNKVVNIIRNKQPYEKIC